MVYLEGIYLVNFSISHQFLYGVVSVKTITSKYLKINKLYTYTDLTPLAVYYKLFNYYFFIIRLLLVLHGHSFFSSPSQRPMTSDFEGFSIPDFIHYIYFLILILEKEQVFPFLMFSDPGPPALNSSTLPLGYWGGGTNYYETSKPHYLTSLCNVSWVRFIKLHIRTTSIQLFKRLHNFFQGFLHSALGIILN